MRPIVRGIAVAVAAVGIAACVKQAWRVTYPGPNNYSYGAAVVQGKDGQTYMAGNLLDQTFVAAYSVNGGLRWKVELPGQGGVLIHHLSREIAVDSDGNLFVSWYSGEASPRRLIKLRGSTGAVMMDRVLDGANDLLLTDMQLGPDGNLYFVNPWANFLAAAAYTPGGDLLWRHIGSAPGLSGELASGDVPVRSLDHYGASNLLTDVASSAAVSRPILSSYMPVEQVFLGQRAVFRVGDEVVAVDGQGDAAAMLTATDLGLSSLQRIAATATGMLVIGTGAQGAATAVYLNQDLEVASVVELNTDADHVLVSSRDGGVCIAAMQGYALGSPPVQLFRLDQTQGIVWQRPVTIEGGSWEFADVSAVADGCYLTAGIFNSEPKVDTVTWRHDQHGALIDTLLLEHFFPYGVLVQGKTVFHVGITGEYDGSVTVATLDKQTAK